MDLYLEEGKWLIPGALQRAVLRLEKGVAAAAGRARVASVPTPRAHTCCTVLGSRAAAFLLTSVYLPPSCAALPTLLRVKPAEAPSKARVPRG